MVAQNLTMAHTEAGCRQAAAATAVTFIFILVIITAATTTKLLPCCCRHHCAAAASTSVPPLPPLLRFRLHCLQAAAATAVALFLLLPALDPACHKGEAQAANKTRAARAKPERQAHSVNREGKAK